MEQFGVIFDMDGVLVLTEQAHWQSWLEAARPRGVTLEYGTFLSCFGRINPDCVRILFGPDTPPEVALRIADEKEAAFRDIIRTHVPLAPGVQELLEGLRSAGARIAVGSSAPPENVDLVLDAGGIRRYFDAIVNAAQVKRGKPAPDVFLLAAERIGMAPETCAVIEDAPAGIAAAVAAGMLPVAVTTTHNADDLSRAGARLLFPTLADVPVEALRSGRPASRRSQLSQMAE